MIAAFIVNTADGSTVARAYASDSADIVTNDGQELVIYTGDDPIEDVETYHDAKGEVAFRARHADTAMDFEVAKANKRQEATAYRDQAEWAGCVTPVGQSDTTPDSQRKVNGAVTMALIANITSAPFSIDWTMADNTSSTLDAQGMISLGVAVGRYVSACHDRGAILKAEIDAAATIEALEAIDITADWPT